MRVVIDTNVLLVSIPSKSKYHPIFQAYLQNKIQLIVTTAILLEYKEILDLYSKKGIGDYIQDSLIAASNVITPEIYFNWNLITQDFDDNKFVDAYVASNADYIVTNDKHFNVLSGVVFPPIKVVSADSFLRILEQLL